MYNPARYLVTFHHYPSIICQEKSPKSLSELLLISVYHRKSGQAVLVHCKMGISRSASTVIAYAMKQHHWSLDTALTYVRDRRSIIKPNEGFMKQLQTYNGILNARSGTVLL